METLDKAVVERIKSNPKYQRLTSTRNKLAWVLSIFMLVVYYGYISLIAFDKSFLAQPLSANGVMSIGVPIGMGIIVFTVLITGFYVWIANNKFDAATKEILEDAKNEK